MTIEIANEDLRGRHSKYLSYAFTEQGVAMLASVLKSDTAVLTSIMIIDAFVALRRFLQRNTQTGSGLRDKSDVCKNVVKNVI